MLIENNVQNKKDTLNAHRHVDSQRRADELLRVQLEKDVSVVAADFFLCN